jgi:hypothetical protein
MCRTIIEDHGGAPLGDAGEVAQRFNSRCHLSSSIVAAAVLRHGVFLLRQPEIILAVPF